MNLRIPQSDDQENAEKAYQALCRFIHHHQNENDIETALWIGPMIAILADIFEENNIPFARFKDAVIEGVNHYKY